MPSAPDLPPDTTAAFDIVCGVDVARETHHVVALDKSGRRVMDKPLPNSETALRALLTGLQQHGQVLLVVDQPAAIGALTIAVATAMDITLAYLPGLTMRRAAQLYPGESKTDARDAFVIADVARRMPNILRRVGHREEILASLGVLAGFDADLAQEGTRLTNRMHDALLHIHPALERLLGNNFRRLGVLDLLTVAGTPQQLRALGEGGIAGLLRGKSPRLAKTLPARILAALDEQTVVVPATAQYGRVINGVAVQLLAVLAQRKQVHLELEALLADHPLTPVLTSMPGIGPRTAIALLLTLGDGSSFATAGHFAAYAGLAPVSWDSGTSIRGKFQPLRGNRELKHLLFISAFASLKHPPSRIYYDRKRAAGKSHTAALICLARRRSDVLFAMVRDGRAYQYDTGSSGVANPSENPAVRAAEASAA